jgi:hypothetical protein
MEQAQVQHEKALAESKILALSSALQMSLRILKDTIKDKHKNTEYLRLINDFIMLSSELLENEDES